MMAEEKGAIPSEAIENGVSHSLIHPAAAGAGLSGEKQIEEMYNDLNKIFDEEYRERRIITAYHTAKGLYEQGYRKQSEGIANNATATDDVVREIFEEIEKYLFYHENIPNTVYKTIDKNIYTRIKKKYTEGGAE